MCMASWVPAPGRTLQLCNQHGSLLIVCRTAHGPVPAPVQQALHYALVSACKVPHALAQLPRQQLAAVGVLHSNPALHAVGQAGQTALRLDRAVLTRVTMCVSFGKDILQRVYVEPMGTERDDAASSRR